MTIHLKFVLKSLIFFSSYDLSNFDFWQLPEHSEEKAVCLPLDGVGFAVGKHRWQTLQFCDQMSLSLFLLDCGMFFLTWGNLLQCNKWIKYQRITFSVYVYAYIFLCMKALYINWWFCCFFLLVGWCFFRILQLTKPMLSHYCRSAGVGSSDSPYVSLILCLQFPHTICALQMRGPMLHIL